jgi:hypothetical protein
MSRIVKILLAANILVFTVLAFVYPHLMIGPGKLIPGHEKLESDCFACHAPLRGAASGHCAACHKPAEIGRLTSAGMPTQNPLTKVAFHQELLNQDCVACHSDHAGVKRFRQQGRFDHALLRTAMREECQSCHKAPGDSLHRQITGNCGRCHEQRAWVPATFDHAEYFELDRDHDTRCITCHVGNDYSRYTCYGCHEHTPANIRREHIEEGIRKFDDCVACHRNADEHDIRGDFTGSEGARGGGRSHGRRDDDD